jgi:hypothetical protein
MLEYDLEKKCIKQELVKKHMINEMHLYDLSAAGRKKMKIPTKKNR